MAIGGAIFVLAANGDNARRRREEREQAKKACAEELMLNFDPQLSTIQEKHAYAECVSLVYPLPKSEISTTTAVLIGVTPPLLFLLFIGLTALRRK